MDHSCRHGEDASRGRDGGSRGRARWLRCRRPLVTVGGELTLDSLELSYNSTSGFYHAPVQAVANGGVLVIDDFGRQQFEPRQFLNRWIVPLESRVDYLTLKTGQKFELPFAVMLTVPWSRPPGSRVRVSPAPRRGCQSGARSPRPRSPSGVQWRHVSRAGTSIDMSSPSSSR